ncbi:phosphatase PAP2 family protein [Pseudomonas luteola]|uniref:phosphatase PAP2 family protein n=1 Tax=Pseudomonas luteola TaxID=47886 RepID=UPI003DA0BD7A
MTHKPLLIAWAGGLVLILLGYGVIDQPIAYWTHAGDLRRLAWPNLMTHVADWLTVLAVLLIIVLGIGQRLLPVHRHRCFVFAFSVLVAKGVKDSLKPVFGRYWPETWTHGNPSLIHNQAYGFNWFHGGDWYASFPSGHTTVAYAAAVAIALCWPRLRGLAVVIAAVVPVGLLLCNYHFFSDVVAGGLLGASVAVLVIKVMGVASKGR